MSMIYVERAFPSSRSVRVSAGQRQMPVLSVVLLASAFHSQQGCVNKGCIGTANRTVAEERAPSHCEGLEACHSRGADKDSPSPLRWMDLLTPSSHGALRPAILTTRASSARVRFTTEISIPRHS
ncbi:hypothetical protein CDAR_390381 [Caerostris darwini]|uniref:Secreted protein n=1 Tax=Caerostris darwini TaxID=1538125 RepID=A0AAV4NXZ4_9ARAC|nr:hypothetical protein CDAR_390381 [Caerostris darwini]